MHRFLSVLVAALALALSGVVAQQGSPSLPEGNLRYGAFTARFAADGTFSLEGQAWPTFTGTWTRDGEIIVLSTRGGPPPCVTPGRYRAERTGPLLSLSLVADECQPRRRR